MVLRPYGGLAWQNRPAPDVPTKAQQAQGLLTAVAATGTVGYLLSREGSNGRRGLDYLYSGARLAGNLSPNEILNTFRAPEFISPFISNTQRGFSSLSWGSESLSSSSTWLALSKITGRSAEELQKAGLGQTGATLTWNAAGHSTGRLTLSHMGKDTVLSHSISLMAANSEETAWHSSERGVNKALFSVHQALGLTEQQGFQTNAVLATADGLRNKWSIIPSITGPLENLGDLNRRTALGRAPWAFGMERINTLLNNTFEQIPVAGEVNKALENLIGKHLPVMSGPATHMFGRLGVKAAVVGGGLLAISQTDWLRRQTGDTGHIAISAGLSGSLAYILNKTGHSPQTAMMVGMASFFGQVILPGFKQGLVPGIANTWATANVARGSDANPFNYHRRILEGFLPGVSKLQTGLLFAAGATAAVSMNIPMTNTTLPNYLLKKFGNTTFGLPSHIMHGGQSMPVLGPSSKVKHFWGQVDLGLSKIATQKPEITQQLSQLRGPRTFINIQKMRLLRANYGEGRKAGFFSAPDWLTHTNTMWGAAEEAYKREADHNPLNTILLQKFEGITNKYLGKGHMGSAMAYGEKAFESLRLGFFGADTSNRVFKAAAEKMGPHLQMGRVGLIFGGLLLAHQLVTGGLLGSMENSQQLKDIYSGRQLVRVNKGRFWEGGGTPYEGDPSSGYWRPHAIALINNRVRERGLYGDDEDKTSPIGKWLRKNFTYNWEREHYYDRPYPITGAFGQDIPVIGSFVAATIGRFIKPARVMHPDEFIRQGEGGGFETADVYHGWKREPAYGLGGIGTGIPTTPLDPTRILGETSSHFREIEGLTGWVKSMIYQGATGDKDFGGQQAVLANSGTPMSMNRLYSEMQLGSAAFLSEGLRRFLPKQFGSGATVNPIMNSMPTWLPEKFRYGDPYTQVEWGEARLPGSGYTALHPELAGMDPEAYPLAYQYSIMADVAPLAKELGMLRGRLYKRRYEGKTTESENALIDSTDKLLTDKLTQYGFNPVDPNAIQLPGSSVTQKSWAGAQSFLRDKASPFEYLGSFATLGLRPIQKLLPDRDPIEQYEYQRMYGTQFAFWNKPVRDWIRPAAWTALHSLGFQGKPSWRKDSDEKAAYFDKLEFIKWMRLSDEARAQGDVRMSIKYQYLAGGTSEGINPKADPMSIYWSLPAEERPYLNAFANAQGAERDRILAMVPSNETELYKTIWSRRDSGDPSLYAGGKSGPDNAYLAQRYAQVRQEMGGQIPSNDWLGYNSEVNLDDVKAVYINSLGKDLHDYGLWESQLREAQRQPYMAGIERPLASPTTRSGIADTFQRLINNGYVTVNSAPVQMYGKMTINDPRDNEIAQQWSTYSGN